MILLMFAGWSTSAQQDTIIFQPSPGQNDGTDDGSEDAGMDTYSDGSNSGANWGASDYVVGTPVSNCNTAMTKQFIQFNLDGLPDGNEVDSVLFGVWHRPHTTYCYSNCDALFYFYRITQSWDEMGVTWYNEPTWDSVIYGPIHITFPNDFGNREYDITQAYRDWKDEVVPNYGFMIYSPTVDCNNAAVMFLAHSSDDTIASQRPYLKIYKRDTSTAVEALLSTFNLNVLQTGSILQISAGDVTADGALLLFDITGRLLDASPFTDGRGRLSVSTVSSGPFVLRVVSSQGSAAQVVFVN